jgi:glutamate-1-semialdehyde 2,1-aminomutase
LDDVAGVREPDHQRSREIHRIAELVQPGGVNSSMRSQDPPIVFTRAKGARLWDADGREYVDDHCAFGPIILGHADDRVTERVVRTIAEQEVVGMGAGELETELAERIVSLVPSV